MLLKNIASISSGQNAPQGDGYYVANGKTFIKASNLDAIIKNDNEELASKISDEAIKDYKLKLYPKDSIIFAKSGLSCKKNRVYLLKEDAYIVNHLCVITLKSSEYNAKWLMYYLMRFNLTQLIKDESYPSISLKDVGNIDIPEVSIEKQNNMVSHLDYICGLIKCKNNEIEYFDECLISKFNEIFGDPNTNPNNYKLDKGKNLFVFSSGKFLNADLRRGEGIPVYGGNGIAWYTDNGNVDFDTIVIGRVGAYCGNARFVPGIKWITDNAIYISSFKTNDFNLIYLNELFNIYNFHQYAGAAAQPKITQKPLEEKEYIIPPIELQEKYANIYYKIEEIKNIISLQINDLNELFNKTLDIILN